MAQIDSRIALGVQAPQIDFGNPLREMAMLSQMEGARAQNKLAELSIAKAQREAADDAALRDIYRRVGGGNPLALAQEAERAGLHGPAAALRKQAAEAEKGELERRELKGRIEAQGPALEAARLKAASEKLTHVAQQLSGVSDQASYDAARQRIAAQFPDVAQSMDPVFDPVRVRAELSRGMTIAQQLEQQHRAITAAETARHNKATEANAAGQLAVAQRNAASREQEVAMGGKPPPGYRWGPNGALEAIPGGPGDPRRQPLTENQSNAGTFAARMAAANDIFDRISPTGDVKPSVIKRGAEAVPVVGTALGMAANAVFASPQQQQIEQAERDFVNATLRRESGAAISEAEFRNARQQYFPQPGDSPEVIAQKRANRQRATQMMVNVVPEAHRQQFTVGTSIGQPGGMLTIPGAGPFIPGAAPGPVIPGPVAGGPTGAAAVPPGPGASPDDPLGIRGSFRRPQ